MAESRYTLNDLKTPAKTDAMLQEVLDRWTNELGLVIPTGSTGVSPAGAHRRDASAPGELPRQIELRRRAEEYRDFRHGDCLLRQPQVAAQS